VRRLRFKPRPKEPGRHSTQGIPHDDGKAGHKWKSRTSPLEHGQPIPLSGELRLDSLHIEQGTPKLDNIFRLGRCDHFKLAFGFALQHRENRFAVFYIGRNFVLEGVSEWRHSDVKYFAV
jgi:hypothetical protein